MKNEVNNPNLLMNEKDMAAYLGISRYFLTELRKKHGLKCLKFEGHHCIYYYLPVVDEFFRKRAKALEAEANNQTEGNLDVTELPVQTGKSDSGNISTCPTDEFHYKPMRAV